VNHHAVGRADYLLSGAHACVASPNKKLADCSANSLVDFVLIPLHTVRLARGCPPSATYKQPLCRCKHISFPIASFARRL